MAPTHHLVKVSSYFKMYSVFEHNDLLNQHISIVFLVFDDVAHVGDEGCDYSAWRVFHTVLGVTSLICLLVALYVYIAIKEYSSMTGKIVFVNIVTTALVMIWFIIVFNRPNIYRQTSESKSASPHAEYHLAPPIYTDEIIGAQGPNEPTGAFNNNINKVSINKSLFNEHSRNIDVKCRPF